MDRGSLLTSVGEHWPTIWGWTFLVLNGGQDSGMFELTEFLPSSKTHRF